MQLFTVQNLSVTFHHKKKESVLVKDVSFSVAQGECVCIVGESGSGKSMTMKAIMGLLDHNFTTNGKAFLRDTDLLSASKETLRQMRGKNMTMILQNPMVCFDSLYRIGYQMAETFQEHTNWSKAEIHAQSVAILEKMQIQNPEEVLRQYPHQCSGGMLQRIMIGIALALHPDVLIADEPTTAIDSITQYEIMQAFLRLKQQGVTIVFITHDLGLAALISDQVLVMNQGKIVDRGTFAEIKTNATDPYTKALVAQKLAVMQAYHKQIGGGTVDSSI